MPSDAVGRLGRVRKTRPRAGVGEIVGEKRHHARRPVNHVVGGSAEDDGVEGEGEGEVEDRG